MAEIAVSIALNKLYRVIREEEDLAQGIPREFADIQKELQEVQPFLKYAEIMAAAEGDDRNEEIRTWLKQLGEASLRIENVVDEYMISIEQQPHDGGCATSPWKAIHFVKTLKLSHQLASEIKQIKTFVSRIKQRSKHHRSCLRPEMPYWFSKHHVVVGVEDQLYDWLMEGPERSVISVVGMPGVGKTTLVRRVFYDRHVFRHFDLHEWTLVSPSYTAESLMRLLLHDLHFEEGRKRDLGIYEMDLDSLIDGVRNCLRQKRYFIIFYDVTSVELWGQIESAMVDNNNGSRILITTTLESVVSSCKKTPSDKVLKLKPLSQEKSMELFCMIAFEDHNNGHCPEDLKKISVDIVEKCEGLPLAITDIGCLLSITKVNPFEWAKVWQKINSEMNRTTKFLGFSYDHLPSYLKSCLLYFGIYPEGYELKSTRLIRQWIAEGFIKDEEGKTLEDIAQQYLTNLIDRNLVQVSSFSIDGKAKSCRVHSILRRMIIRKINDSSFCQRISTEDELMPRDMIPRLLITSISNDLMESTASSCTRSLFFVADETSALTNKFVQSIPTKYRLLKVLDFEGSRMRSIPENWGNLAQLKYLSLREAWYLNRKLPKFIGKLQMLETLDIRGTDVRELPKEICKLRKLRHLLGDDMILFQMKSGLGGMTSLQTLRHVNLTMDEYDDGIEFIKELGKLNQLRNLSLTGVKEEQVRALCSSINEMRNLEKLSINSYEDEVIDLPDISTLPKLKKLCLNVRLKMFPEWIPQLGNLVKLSLRNSKLTNDPMDSLENMPRLLFLDMNHAYDGESLHFKNGVFPQLRELSLGPLDNLESIIIEEGALSSLKKFELWRIPKLKTVPLGIQHLEKLEVVDVFAMSNEFNHCIAPQGGPENPIIHHVPRVTITTNFGERTRVISH